MIMKKQPQKRSPRYRFWRKVGLMTAAGLIGGGLGVLTGMLNVKFICNNFDYNNHYSRLKCNVNSYDPKSLIIDIFFLPVSKYHHCPRMLRH
jgi:hypothetical protein